MNSLDTARSNAKVHGAFWPTRLRSPAVVVAGLATALLILVAVSLSAGDRWLSPAQLYTGVLGTADSPELTLLVRYARAPRIVLALLVGGALAIAGLLMQTLSRNPLATPSVLGIGGGANLGLLIAIVTLPGLGEPIAVGCSFLGALLSACIIVLMGLSGGTRLDRDRLIIGGSILGALFGSLVMGILFFGEMQNVMLGWTLGRLIHVDWFQVWFVALVIGAGLLLAIALAGKLDAFRLGEHTAAGLGVRVREMQLAVLLAVVLLAGGSVAAAGPIAFVGLVVPHLIRANWFRSPRLRLIACFFAGGLLTVAADLLSRLTSHERVIPMGIWTMALGAIFFMSLSLRGTGGSSLGISVSQPPPRHSGGERKGGATWQ